MEQGCTLAYSSTDSPEGIMVFEQLLVDYVWFGLMVYGVIYCGDFALTMYSASLYRKHGSAFIEYEGSFELTPFFQSDVDSLRIISPRFLLILTIQLAYLFTVWYLATGLIDLPELYFGLLGALMLLEIAVLHGHLRNIQVFRSVRRRQCLSGHIRYTRWLMLRRSSCDFLGFALLFLFLGIVTESWFVLGGSYGCFTMALKHWRLSNKQKAPILAQSTPPPLDTK